MVFWAHLGAEAMEWPKGEEGSLIVVVVDWETILIGLGLAILKCAVDIPEAAIILLTVG